jgi:phenylpyruvate tautomerase PptA (4-oxalocrotonate tautomerase family)
MSNVYVYVAQEQTLDQKRALIKEITDVLVRNIDVAPEAVMVRIMAKSKGVRSWAPRSAARSLH